VNKNTFSAVGGAFGILGFSVSFAHLQNVKKTSEKCQDILKTPVAKGTV
jgi:hypothetical protein